MILLVSSSDELNFFVSLLPAAYSININMWKSSVKAVYNFIILGWFIRLQAYNYTNSCSSISYSWIVDLNIFFNAYKLFVALFLCYFLVTCIRVLNRICHNRGFVLFQTFSLLFLFILHEIAIIEDSKTFLKQLAI